MPIQLSRLKREMIFSGDASTGFAGLPPHDESHDGPKGDVQSMKTSHCKESAGVKVIGQPKWQGEVLHHLTHQKGQAQNGCQKQPAPAALHVTSAQIDTSAMERGTTNKQKNGVKNWEWKLQLVHSARKKRVNSLKREISSEKPCKCHRVSHQKGG